MNFIIVSVVIVDFVLAVIFCFIYSKTENKIFSYISLFLFATTIPIGIIGFNYVWTVHEKIKSKRAKEIKEKLRKDKYYERYL